MVSMDNNPLILAFAKELNTTVRIENAALRMGMTVEIIETADQIAPSDSSPLLPQSAEHLWGRSAVLLEKVTGFNPALIIFDLGNESIPWKDWISLLTSVPATRRIPVIGFGPHVEVQTLESAKEAGATQVISRSRFFSNLPGLIQKYARLIDRDELKSSCQEPLAPSAVLGLEEFNRGEYFEAHEYLESAWKNDESSGRELYRAVLQVAVAYYQILRGNYNGAAKMFLRLRQWIDPLPDHCRGVNVRKLRQEAKTVHETMLSLGPERISELDNNLLKPVEYSSPN